MIQSRTLPVFCVSNFLSILARKKLINFSKLQFLKDNISRHIKKKNWHLSIWQNWCFVQFHHSRIEVLPNCSTLFCVSLFCERWLERMRGNLKHKNLAIAIVRGICFSMIHSMMKWYHKAPLFFWGRKSVNIYLSKDILPKKKYQSLWPFCHSEFFYPSLLWNEELNKTERPYEIAY